MRIWNTAAVAEAFEVQPSAFSSVVASDSNLKVLDCFTHNSIEEITGIDRQLVDIPEQIIAIEAVQTSAAGRRLIQADLLAFHNSLLPIGQQHARQRLSALTYAANGVLEAVPADSVVIAALPDTVRLTRVVSVAEATKYRTQDPSIGSSKQHLWHNVVHTALHNVTNEFEGRPGYERIVGFAMPISVLNEHLDAGQARIGIYDYRFAGRQSDSPLPVDAEIRFSSAAYADLQAAYVRWSNIEQVYSLPVDTAD